MHTLLENVLVEVAAHLGTLPPRRRADELREMRTHLENAVTVNLELGQSEDEAAQNAVAQFGTPQDLGENVVWAWRRGEVRQKRSFWGAASCAFALTIVLPFLQNTPLEGPLLSLFRFMGTNGQVAGPPVEIALLALAGGICGLVFPKRAFSGIVLGVTAWHALFLAMLFVIVVLEKLVSPVPSCSVTMHSTSVLLAILAAWMGSRARLAWGGRVRG